MDPVCGETLEQWSSLLSSYFVTLVNDTTTTQMTIHARIKTPPPILDKPRCAMVSLASGIFTGLAVDENDGQTPTTIRSGKIQLDT